MKSISTKTTDQLASIGKDFNHFDDKTGGFIMHLQKAGEMICHNAKGSLLELGCGSGIMSSVFAKHFERMVVVDGSETYLERTRELSNAAHVEYVHRLFDDFKTEELFDNIVLAHVLEHMDDPKGLFQFASSLLNDDGTIHLIFPNAASLHRRMGLAMNEVPALDHLNEDQIGRGYKHLFNIDQMCEIANDAGLTIFAKQGVYVRLENLSFIKDHYSESQLQALFKLPEIVPEQLWTECYLQLKKSV